MAGTPLKSVVSMDNYSRWCVREWLVLLDKWMQFYKKNLTKEQKSDYSNHFLTTFSFLKNNVRPSTVKIRIYSPTTTEIIYRQRFWNWNSYQINYNILQITNWMGFLRRCSGLSWVVGFIRASILNLQNNLVLLRIAFLQ